jgi:hypothetical protein
MKTRLFLLAALLAATAAQASIPDAVPYQGRIAANGVNFTGTGQFKFAIYQHPTGTYLPAATTAVLTGGFLTSVTIVSGGSGYSAAGVTVSFTGGGGSGATATASVVNGAISAITVTGAGTGYTSAPTVVFSDPAAPAQLWNCADGATTGALVEPSAAVALAVDNGSYNAGLGDIAIPGMAALPVSLVPAAGQRSFVRVWFNDGTHGFQALSPDTELRSVPFAREAANTASISGVALTDLPQLNAANTFTNVNGLIVKGDGPHYAEGTFNKVPATGATVLSGSGTRMEFLPGYSAFRAGTVSNSQWDMAKIGLYSTAMGSDTTASGNYSTAMGDNTTASGNRSTAMGAYSTASGASSTAIGWFTIASGQNSTAMGAYSTASGHYSTAMGMNTTAKSYFETAIGCYNTDYTPANTTASVRDRLFVIGNGTSGADRSDALVMLKSGQTTLNGQLQVNAMDGLSTTGTGPNTGVYPHSAATGATVPLTGAGTRLEFLPGYSALRAGTATGTQWDAATIGTYSTAIGHNTIASGYISTAFGSSTTASGIVATSFGSGTTASGIGSTAMGGSTSAKSFIETALGLYNTDYTPASATTWVADDRLFVLGNGTSDSARSDALIVYKNGNAILQGDLSAKSFVTTSDRNRKTDIVPADTAAVLTKVAALPVSTWKYKEETVTHLGPMAQDFFAAFHLGSTDTGIATVDADGVALASIQELKKQLDAKEARIAQLEREQAATNARLAALEAKLAK